MADRQDILDGLVGTPEILLDGHVVLDLGEDEGGSDDEGDAEQGPVADELGAVGEVAGVEVVDDGGSDGLDALVETDVVGRTTTRVGERAHEPVGDVSNRFTE